LREAGAGYELQHHPLAFTAREVAASEHVPGRLMAKVVVVYADGQPAMLVMPATSRVDLPAAEVALRAASVRLAREDELKQLFPDCDVGSMPPFGNLYGLPVYVDRDLAEDEMIYFQVGTHTDTMRVRYADFERLAQPQVMSFGYHPGAVAVG
jgi:Ala-tRNA(Pro) deacylase